MIEQGEAKVEILGLSFSYFTLIKDDLCYYNSIFNITSHIEISGAG